MQISDHPPAPARSILHPFLDFWLLGGASVGIWIILKVSGLFRGGNFVVDQRFMQIAVAFSMLTLICNHPHFIISYQFGYGRGWPFVRRHWFALMFVPLFLIAIFATAYFSFSSDPVDGWLVQAINQVFQFLGLGFRFGLQNSLGKELLDGSVWLMYLTVGWHYSKQIFGCMMVYGRFDNYVLDSFQRLILKGSVFSVAFIQFSYLYRTKSSDVVGNSTQTQFVAQLTPLGLPDWFYNLSIAAGVFFFVAVLLFIFAAKVRDTGRFPSPNFLIPWIAFHVWWIPIFELHEYSFLMVPFFHSLQYLPFAYRVGTPQFQKNSSYYVKVTLHAALILVLGFFAFEGLPFLLDRSYNPMSAAQPVFFLTAFVVFINVHHFFIDSVVWRLEDQRLRTTLFTKP